MTYKNAILYILFPLLAVCTNLLAQTPPSTQYTAVSGDFINRNFLPDSIYNIALKQIESHKTKDIGYTAAAAKLYFDAAKQQLVLHHNGLAIAGFLTAATVHQSVREAALVNAGIGLYNLEFYNYALHYYELAIKENPKSYEAYLNMGAAAKHVKNDVGFSMEPVYFKIAYNLKPGAHKAIYNYATTLMSQSDRKNNDLAIELLNKAIVLAPENPTYIWTLGKTYHNISDMGNREAGLPWYQKAIEQYNKAIGMDKYFHEAYLSKARSLLGLYEASSIATDRKMYMDSLNACYVQFKAVGGIDKTALFKKRLFDYPEDHKSIKNYNDLVPEGWKIRDKAEDDFNRDGHPDFAVVVQLNDPAKMIKIIKYNLPNHPDGMLNHNPSILYVALYNPLTAQYDIVAKNHRFYEISNGYEDYSYKLSSSKGVLKLVRAYHPARPYSFWFRYQNNKMEMIGREINYLRETGDHYKENYSINYSTKKLIYTVSNLKTGKISKFEYTNIQEPNPGDIESIKETINLDNNIYLKAPSN